MARSPSSARAGAIVVVALLSGCGSKVDPPSAPTTPSGVPAPQAPQGSNAITGTITARNGDTVRPAIGASVSAWVSLGGFGYSYMWAHGATYADESGRYRLSNLPDGAQVTAQIYQDGFVQQCAAPTLQPRGEVRLDLEIVSRSAIPADPASVPPPSPGYRSISGDVFESASGSRHPLAGVFVDYEPIPDFPAAVTLTDAAGRYVLCGVPTATTVEITAGFGGRVATVQASAGQTSNVDIEFSSDK